MCFIWWYMFICCWRNISVFCHQMLGCFSHLKRQNLNGLANPQGKQFWAKIWTSLRVWRDLCRKPAAGCWKTNTDNFSIERTWIPLSYWDIPSGEYEQSKTNTNRRIKHQIRVRNKSNMITCIFGPHGFMPFLAQLWTY